MAAVSRAGLGAIGVVLSALRPLGGHRLLTLGWGRMAAALAIQPICVKVSERSV